MANKYIGDVTTSTPALTDFLVGVNGSDAYKTLVSDVAKKIIEDYSGSTIGGSAQTIQNAFLGVNNNIGANNITGANNRQGWTALTTGQDLDAIYTPGVYACTDTVANTIEHPMKGYASSGFVMVVSLAANANTNYAQEIKYVSKGLSAITLRRTAYTNKEWGGWQRVVQNDEFLGALSRSGINMLSNQNPVGVQEINGLTITTNSDGTIVINGTATANTEYYLSTRTQPRNIFPAGQLWLSGCPAGGSGSTYRIGYNRGSSGSTLGNDTGSGILINEPTGANNYGVWIGIGNGVVCDNLTFRPMVCDARLRYVDYVPYGMSNAELTPRSITPQTQFGTLQQNGSFIQGGLVVINCRLVLSQALTGNSTADILTGLPQAFIRNYSPVVKLMSTENAYTVDRILSGVVNGTTLSLWTGGDIPSGKTLDFSFSYRTI